MNMMSSSTSRSLQQLVFTIFLLFLQATIVTSICRVDWDGRCASGGVPRTTAQTVTLQVIDDTDGSSTLPEYNATVIFYWGPTDTSLGSKIYQTGTNHSEVGTYQYDVDGVHYFGYSVTFEEGSGRGCEGVTFEKYYRVMYDDEAKTCGFSDSSVENVPTREPTDVSSNLLVDSCSLV